MHTEADLRQALAELAATAPDPATAKTQMQLRSPMSPRRRPGTALVASCVSLAVVVAVVATVVVLRPGPDVPREPVGPTLAEQYRGSVTIDPATAAPGEWVTLHFPEAGHGTSFTLDTWTGSGWERSYYLVAYSMSGTGRTKSWWRAGEEGGMPQPFGTATERVIVPPIATPGVYRVCQLGADEPARRSSTNSTRKACGLLTVT